MSRLPLVVVLAGVLSLGTSRTLGNPQTVASQQPTADKSGAQTGADGLEISAPGLSRPSASHADLEATSVGSGTNTNSTTPFSPLVGQALKDDSALEDSPNLVARKAQGEAEQRAAWFQGQLELARAARQNNAPAQAAARLASLLEKAGAPDEIKRAAMLELAAIAREEGQIARALQIYAQYAQTFPSDPSVPEVLLRQGLLYRDMGAPANALNKFFAVLSSSLTVRLSHMEYYQRLVLRAQTEIAETYYLQGKHADAASTLERLLKLDAPELNRPAIHYKLVRALANLERWVQVVSSATDLLGRYSDLKEEPEVRYILTTALKRLGRNQEATEQVLLLLRSQQSNPNLTPEQWLTWQLRTGNDIANQLYKDGDYQGALQVYQQLAHLNAGPAWQLPALYQVGLVLEHLRQPVRAIQTYEQILAREADIGTNAPSPSLATLVDMARWRRSFLTWQTNVEVTARTLVPPSIGTNALAVLK